MTELRLPDGAWHLAHGIYAGIKHGAGIEPHAWERPYRPPTVTVDTGNGTLTTCGTTSYCDRARGFWPRTEATLALAIRETEVVERIEAARVKQQAHALTAPAREDWAQICESSPDDTGNFKIGMTVEPNGGQR